MTQADNEDKMNIQRRKNRSISVKGESAAIPICTTMLIIFLLMSIMWVGQNDITAKEYESDNAINLTFNNSLDYKPIPIIMQTNNWTNMSPNIHPSARSSHAMTYDSESDKIILFGGNIDNDESNETWSYDYKTNIWKNMTSKSGPSARSSYSLAYDSQDDRIILFGPVETWTETWAYDYNHNIWRNQSPLIQPPLRSEQTMAYDSKSDRLILFGGFCPIPMNNHICTLADTWVYDYTNNTWINMTTDIHPPIRGWHAMVYDSESDRIILFGGLHEDLHGGYAFYDDTWTYDYNNNKWENVTAEQKIRPPAIASHEMAYDSQNDRVILFGGFTSKIQPFNYTWSYDFNANTWMNVTPTISPPTKLLFAMAYDSESDRIILFGGDYALWPTPSDDTWALVLGMLLPVVIDTIPIDGETDVSLNSNVVITFSSVMNRSATGSAVSIKPSPIAGKEWNNRNTMLTLTVSLEEKTEYTIKISTEAKDVKGMSMESNYTFTFTTGYKDMNSWIIPLITLVLLLVVIIGLYVILERRRRKGQRKGNKIVQFEKYCGEKRHVKRSDI